VEAVKKLRMELTKERVQLDTECTVDEVEQEAASCQKAMSTVLDARVKMIRICTRSQTWLNADGKERRRMVGSMRRKRRIPEEASWAKAQLQKILRRSIRTAWRNGLQNIGTGEVWRAGRSLNPWVGMTVEALTDSEGKEANTSSEMEEMLRHNSFPPNDGNQYI